MKKVPPEGSPRGRRILSVVTLMLLLASLGIGSLACARATPVPAVPPAATPAWTPEAWTPFPTPPPVTPPPGVAPASTTTKSYWVPVLGTEKETLDLKRGDIVVLSVTVTGLGLTVMVADPSGGEALRGQAILGWEGKGKISFAAKVDGRYTLILQTAMGAGDAFVTVTTEIYRS